jgi:hypothetical protein
VHSSPNLRYFRMSFDKVVTLFRTTLLPVVLTVTAYGLLPVWTIPFPPIPANQMSEAGRKMPRAGYLYEAVGLRQTELRQTERHWVERSRTTE